VFGTPGGDENTGNEQRRERSEREKASSKEAQRLSACYCKSVDTEMAASQHAEQQHQLSQLQQKAELLKRGQLCNTHTIAQ
jgi:hypothetical protein